MNSVAYHTSIFRPIFAAAKSHNVTKRSLHRRGFIRDAVAA
jgi:hypothetical protein